MADDQRAGHAHRAQGGDVEGQQRQQADHDRRAREQHRPAGGGHRPGHGPFDRPSSPRAELLAEAADDEQRIVDAQAEAEHGGQVEREDRQLEEPAEQDHQRQGDRDGRAADQAGHGAGHDGAEDQHQRHGSGRDRQQLGAAQIAFGDVEDVLIEDRRAGQGHVCSRRRRRSGVLDARHDVAHVVGSRRSGSAIAYCARPSGAIWRGLSAAVVTPTDEWQLPRRRPATARPGRESADRRRGRCPLGSSKTRNRPDGSVPKRSASSCDALKASRSGLEKPPAVSDRNTPGATGSAASRTSPQQPSTSRRWRYMAPPKARSMSICSTPSDRTARVRPPSDELSVTTKRHVGRHGQRHARPTRRHLASARHHKTAGCAAAVFRRRIRRAAPRWLATPLQPPAARRPAGGRGERTVHGAHVDPHVDLRAVHFEAATGKQIAQPVSQAPAAHRLEPGRQNDEGARPTVPRAGQFVECARRPVSPRRAPSAAGQLARVAASSAGVDHPASSF